MAERVHSQPTRGAGSMDQRTAELEWSKGPGYILKVKSTEFTKQIAWGCRESQNAWGAGGVQGHYRDSRLQVLPSK